MQRQFLARQSKRALLLFELLIALGLTAILLTVLFRFFAGSLKMDQKIEEARKILYPRQHFQTRVSSILTSLVRKSMLPPSAGASLYTIQESDKTSLIGIFDNGIDPDPAFSGPIVGKIYIDEQSNLSLGLWPLDKGDQSLYRKEILLSHIEELRFQFLAKKNLESPDTKAISINSSTEWRTNWPKNRWDIPSIIRLSFKQNQSELGFAFPLPILEPIATYEDTGVGG